MGAGRGDMGGGAKIYWVRRWGQNVKGFVNEGKDFMLYSSCSGEPSKGFKQKHII